MKSGLFQLKTTKNGLKFVWLTSHFLNNLKLKFDWDTFNIMYIYYNLYKRQNSNYWPFLWIYVIMYVVPPF